MAHPILYGLAAALAGAVFLALLARHPAFSTVVGARPQRVGLHRLARGEAPVPLATGGVAYQSFYDCDQWSRR